jgi:predicted CXXCH cytochrome family protein
MKATRSARLKLFVVAVFAGAGLFLLLSSLFERKVTAEPQQRPPGATAFSHDQHLKVAGLDCTSCHKPTSEGAVTLARPNHESCNSCHQEWFAADLPKKDFCTVCHTNVSQEQLPELRSFPNYNKDNAILFDFSHKLHLHLKGKVTQVVGARLDCNVCHSIAPGGEKATFPAHSECATCHNQPDIKPSLRSDSTNQDCLGCHTSAEQNNPNYKKLRRFIVDPAHAQIMRGSPQSQVVDVRNPIVAAGNTMTGRDLKFSHDKHLKDSRNEGITCDTCHVGIDQKTSISQLSIPSMWDCTMCHESRRTRSDFRISNCSVCHTQITAGQKPRNHTLTERPYDHTAAFRTRHAEAARAPDAKCSFCHEMVSDPRLVTAGIIRTEERYVVGARSCDECHTVMRPRSHTVRWRSDLHGRMASMNRMNCAVCHQADFCIRCHNERPRSHNPLNAFVNGGHRFAAQINQRSCFTCHEFSQTCERCHSAVLR